MAKEPVLGLLNQYRRTYPLTGNHAPPPRSSFSEKGNAIQTATSLTRNCHNKDDKRLFLTQ